jgi:alkylation response protein AidB-like acyl-CoA dehydrogenase
MTLLFLLGFILLTLITIYFTHKFYLWSLFNLVYLGITYHLGDSLHYSVIWTIFAILYVLLSIVILIKPLRKIFLKNIYLKAKNVLPKISETEALALNAGGTWFEQEIFCGNPDFNRLHSYKKFQLSVEEKDFLNNEVTELCKLVNDWEINKKEHDLSISAWNFMREKGFFGLVIEKEYGGKGFSALAHSEIVVKLATKSPTLAVTVMVPNSLGPGELLQHYGTPEQKEYYLPRLALGTEIPCFALTSPTAGSDATSIVDEGIVCEYEDNGKKILGIRLQNVEKRYITLAPVATLVGLAFQLKDPDGLLNGSGREGITCAILPHDLKGLEIGNRLLPLHVSFMNGTIRIKEALIPISSIIGGQKMAGEGWRMLVECLSIGRAISLPACGTAQAMVASIATSAYAYVREQFHLPISSFEGVEEELAKIGGLTYIADATRHLTSLALYHDVRPSVASAIAKYHLTEIGRIVINKAMDIHGGRGVIMGPHNYLAGVYDSVPVGITVEGANIMTRNLLIYGQGMMKCHPYLRREYNALAVTDGLADFDKALFAHIGYFLQNKVKAIFQAFTCGCLLKGYPGKFRAYYRDITRLSSALSYVSDVVLMVLGGELKRKERISARLGDVMSYLYMASATLKYFEDNGKLVTEEVFVTWGLDYCLFNAQEALINIFDNFPYFGLGLILKLTLFPYGRIFKQPDDRLDHALSQNLLHNSETRRRWKNTCFVLKDDFTDPISRIETAFQAVLKAKIIKSNVIRLVKEKHLIWQENLLATAKIAYANSFITLDELNVLELSLNYVQEVIQVDEFPPYELGPKNAHPDWQNPH